VSICVDGVEIFGFHKGWFYYCYYSEDGDMYEDGLYRMRTDGTGKMKVLEKEGVYWPRFDDEWMYFTNTDDHGTLYKVRIDGTGKKTKLNDDEYSYISAILDGWIYYYSNVTTYRVRTNGMDRQVLYDDRIEIIGLANGSIYFEDMYYLYKMRPDGTGITKLIVTNGAIGIMGILDGWIYYWRPEISGCRLSRMRTDGSDEMELDVVYHHSFPDNIMYRYRILFSDERIYGDGYSGDAAKIWSIRMDGTDEIDIVCEDLWEFFAVDNDWIYYQSKPTFLYDGNNQKEIKGKIYRIRTDGSEKQEIVF
jgi:hypothetical protein